MKNLIPLEIAQKICEKIEQGQEFVAYIVIPMFPEGNPEDAAMQEILHWQFHTIEMMYSKIAKALAKVDSGAHPQ
ncbi:hypothetical protein GUF49_01425, partial [Xanthomonas citri pv. citri]|nr:hypothetical protein [Xanthomonas citri pv. citri]